MRIRKSLPLGIVASAFLSVATAQVSFPTCYESDIGTLVGFGEETVFGPVPLGFAFPFAGTTFTDILIATSGFITPGVTSNGPGLINTAAELLSGLPRICPLWSHLYCEGGVWFNSLPASGSNPRRAVITWLDARDFISGPNFTFQLQIADNGAISMWWDPGFSMPFEDHLVGFSGGAPAVNPGNSVLSALLPMWDSGSEPTIYQQFGVGGFDLAGRTIEFEPNTNGGYLMRDRSGCAFVGGSWSKVGTGCPTAPGNARPEFYELFSANTFDLSNTAFELVPSGLGYEVRPTTSEWKLPFVPLFPLDDEVLFPPLYGFTFPHPAGSTNVIGFCSNGYLWLDPLMNVNASFDPNVAEFLGAAGPSYGLGPRFCPAWVDLNPPAGGQCYFEVYYNSVVATWENVPEYGWSGQVFSFQCELYQDGRIVTRYRNMGASSHGMLVGYSRGGNVPDPGNTDLSAAIPFAVGYGPESVLLDSNTTPVIGQTFPMEVSHLPANSVLGLSVLGFGSANVPLDPIGMPGCILYQTNDILTLFPLAGPVTDLPLAIPSSPQVLGYTLRAQVAIFALGVNPANIAISNGGIMTIGTY